MCENETDELTYLDEEDSKGIFGKALGFSILKSWWLLFLYLYIFVFSSIIWFFSLTFAIFSFWFFIPLIAFLIFCVIVLLGFLDFFDMH